MASHVSEMERSIAKEIEQNTANAYFPQASSSIF